MVQERVLQSLESESLVAHIVWTPVMATDDRASVDSARELFSDPRVLQYWDPDRSLGTAFAQVVDLPPGNDQLAWDIYFVYEPGATWGEHPPVPANWWHQLALDEKYLADGEGLRRSLQGAAGL